MRLSIPLALVLAAGAWFTPGLMARGDFASEGLALEAAIAEVEAGRRTTPLVGDRTASGDFPVTFLAKSPGGQVPRIVSDATGWGENAADNTFDFDIGRMTRVAHTDWYALRTTVAPRARIEYLIVHGTDYRADPYNPRLSTERAGGPASEFVTPGWVPPDDFTGASAVPAGAICQEVVASPALGGTRRVIVYTPPGYRPDRGWPVAVFASGVSPAKKAGTPAVAGDGTAEPPIEPDIAPDLLDQWIARKAMRPVVVLFVEPQRYADAKDCTSEAVRSFFTQDLMDWAVRRCGVSTHPDDRAILAVSAGAKEAVESSVVSPPAFGGLGLFIPGRRVGREPDVLALVRAARHVLRVTILAGQYDVANLPAAQALRRACTNAGHTVDYILVAEGHNKRTWHNHVREVLASLFPL